MGFWDEMNFDKWLETNKENLEGLSVLDQLQKAYEDGFKKGAEAQGDYDPRWDAD